MRTLSLMTRSRTRDLVSERYAAEISFSRPSNCGSSFSAASSLTRSSSASRSCLPAMVSAWASSLLTAAVERLQDVVLVVEEDRELAGRLGGLGGEVGLGLAEHLDEGLRGVQTGGDDLLGRRLGAALDQLDGLLGGLGLDHHDRDVAVLQDAAGDDHVEDGVLELGVRREGDPLAVDQRDADAADRAGEGQAGQLRGRGGGVDRDHVVQVVGVERHDRRDDLDLVAQALLEGRAQRAVDQAAGEDRVLGGTALTAEEGAGDLAGGVHPLLDVHREGEEVELVLGLLGGGGGRQHHGVVVQVRHGGAGGLLGQAARLEADGAGAEGAVVDDGLGVVGLVLH